MSVQLKTNKQMHKSCKAITKRKKGRIMNIYLAGDSIVQNYTEEEFIAGWGQYLKYYVTPDTKVFNCAKGGRSSRLFLNEGRFDKIDESICFIAKTNFIKCTYCIVLSHSNYIWYCNHI